MGGFLHLFDFHHGSGRRKHKKQGRDTAPRKSLEVPAESCRSHYAKGVSEKDLPKRNYYPTDTTMKKFANQEISRHPNNKQNALGVVARLMGMDMLPGNKKPEGQLLEEKIEVMETTDKTCRSTDKVPAVHTPEKLKSSIKKEHRFYKDAYSRYWNSSTNFGRSRPHVHPQEKELQKFKKEFEAWQAVRFLECARAVELGNIPEQWLAQLNLTKEKMAVYESSRKPTIEKSKVCRSDALNSRSFRGDGIQHSRSEKEIFPAEDKEPYSFSSRSSRREYRKPQKDSDRDSEKSSEPTRIVILKPGSDSFRTNDESWLSSTSSVEDRDCIEDLLEEVKERLKFDTQCKTFKKTLMVRGGGIETPVKERAAYTKQTYQPFEKQISEKANRELGRKLLRSESEISYQSTTGVSELAPSSPELMSRRSTRKLLSERLAMVLNGQEQRNTANFSDNFSGAPFDDDDARERLEKARDILNVETGRNYWHCMSYYADRQARSFSRELSDDTNFQEQSSPRNLVRSLSVPVPGTSFGKLLLEDRYVSTGAHIKRKHEAFDKFSVESKGQSRERFNIREKVSNIKSSLSFRKKKFNKKLQSVDLSQEDAFGSVKDIMNGSTILTSFNDRNENLTEVPPSPASICSSPRGEFWKPTDYFSPLSTSDVTSIGDHSVGNVFREITSNVTELRKQLNQLECEGSVITTVTDVPSEPEMIDLEDEAETYIKDLLVTSGLYDGSWDKSFSRWDPYLKPVSKWVFDKVEESYQKTTDDIIVSESCDEMKWEHKILFDLMNEALTVVLGPPRTLSKFRRKITDATMLPKPQGQKLVELVWQLIREYVYPSTDAACYSLDDLVAHGLNIMPWSSLIDEEIGAMGKELGYQITSELVEELVIDMQF